MLTITRSFEWDMGHRVPNHKSLCKNPHGHRYVMNVCVSGLINKRKNDSEQDMIVDFGKLKVLVNSHLVDTLDHSFMYFEGDTIMGPLSKQHPSLKLIPVPFVPTAECIVQYAADKIEKILRQDMPKLTLESVELFETPKSKATWSKDA